MVVRVSRWTLAAGSPLIQGAFLLPSHDSRRQMCQAEHNANGTRVITDREMRAKGPHVGCECNTTLTHKLDGESVCGRGSKGD